MSKHLEDSRSLQQVVVSFRHSGRLKIGNMRNSSRFMVTLAHHSTSSQGYPQKVWRKSETFTNLLLSCCIPL